MANFGKSKLGRRSAHRLALLVQSANALIKHKRIFITRAKAKMVARFIAPIITHARKNAPHDFLHARSHAFARLRDKQMVKALFADVVPMVGDRAGGYTRIIALESPSGMQRERVLLEFVDYNTLYSQEKKAKSTKKNKKKNKVEGVEDAKKSAQEEGKSPKKSEKGGEKKAVKAEKTTEAKKTEKNTSKNAKKEGDRGQKKSDDQ